MSPAFIPFDLRYSRLPILGLALRFNKGDEIGANKTGGDRRGRQLTVLDSPTGTGCSPEPLRSVNKSNRVKLYSVQIYLIR